LLALASAIDNRKPDRDTASIWAVMLGDLSFEDCRDAIAEHYRTKRDWLMPADTRRIVTNRRRSRIEAVGHVEPPRELEGIPERENAWTTALNRALGDGLDRDAAMAAANDALGIDPKPIERTVDVKGAIESLGKSMRDWRARDRDEGPTTQGEPR